LAAGSNGDDWALWADLGNGAEAPEEAVPHLAPSAGGRFQNGEACNLAPFKAHEGVADTPFLAVHTMTPEDLASF
jgi:hypothetical protein